MMPLLWLRTAWLLTRDTLRQSFASGISWLLLGLSSVGILVCLSTSVHAPLALTKAGQTVDFLPRFDRDAQDARKLKQSGVVVADGKLTLLFGAVKVPVARDVPDTVHYLQLILGAGVVDTIGLLLALVWSAGFVPGFLDKRVASVLLTKPVPRTALLLGKYVGVLAFVLLQGAYFVVGTWLALAVRTGVWDARYLICIPLLLLQFGIFFSFSLLLAVCFRSTVVCVFGSISFWAICWGMNLARYAVLSPATSTPDGSFSAPLVWLANAVYWLLPKPLDLGRLVFDAVGADSHFHPLLAGSVAASSSLVVLTSMLFAGYLLLASARQLSVMDY